MRLSFKNNDFTLYSTHFKSGPKKEDIDKRKMQIVELMDDIKEDE